MWKYVVHQNVYPKLDKLSIHWIHWNLKAKGLETENRKDYKINFQKTYKQQMSRIIMVKEESRAESPNLIEVEVKNEAILYMRSGCLKRLKQ